MPRLGRAASTRLPTISRRRALSLLPASLAWSQRPAPSRPNIVLIMADDLGFSDIGPYGSEIATPNLDALARRGVRFTQFYNCARCVPTRASLLTGLYPHKAGVGYMEPGNRYNDAIQARRSLPEYQGYLNRSCITIAEALRTGGYQTFMTGKWHVGAAEGQRPWERGFQRFYGILGGASNHFRPGKALWSDGKPAEAPPNFYSTDAFSDRAADFIQDASPDRPLFLYTAYTAPHWPIQAPDSEIAKYRGKYRTGWDELRQRRFARQKSLGLFGPGTRLSDRHAESYPWQNADHDEMDLRMAVYAAMIDRMDQGIGRIVDALRRTGRENNTLILFLSDNGACAEPYGRNSIVRPGPAESATGYLLPWANASNTPFRLFKHWVHEGGIATPFIASWPGRIKGGAINTRKTGHVKDILPTCLDAAGVAYLLTHAGNSVEPLAGASLLPALADPRIARNEVLFWEHEGNRAVRDGKWKLVSYFNEIHQEMNRVGTGRRTGTWELYDLESDRTETRNLAQAEPGRTRQMIAQYDRWAASTGVRDWDTLISEAGFGRLE
jgi:arylsulfatase A-like enzyme